MFSRLQTWLHWLQSSPVEFMIYFVLLAVAVLASLTLHELAHGYVAYRCGDPTAKMLGRLSLNPLKHLDPFGAACLLLLGFGWAKPVPVNPRNFQNYRRDDFMVSIAGITVNLTLFILSTALLVGLNSFIWTEEALLYIGLKDLVSIQPTVNVLAKPETVPLLQILLKNPMAGYVQQFLAMFASINLGLGIFNLLPLPPLDGFHVVNDILLKGRLRLNPQVFRMAHIIVLVLCFSGALSGVLNLVMDTVESAVVNLFLKMIGRG